MPGFLCRQDDIRREYLFGVHGVKNIVASAEFAVDLHVTAFFDDGTHFVVSKHAQHRGNAVMRA